MPGLTLSWPPKSGQWCGVKIIEFELRQVQALREDLERAHAGRINPVVASATGNRPTKVSSKIGT